MFEDDEIQRQLEDEARLKRKQRISDVRWLMDDVRGRRFVWKQLVDTRFEGRTTLFDTHGGRQNYLLGAYEVGRSLADEIRTLCPEQYLLMVRENTLKQEETAQ